MPDLHLKGCLIHGCSTEKRKGQQETEVKLYPGEILVGDCYLQALYDHFVLEFCVGNV